MKLIDFINLNPSIDAMNEFYPIVDKYKNNNDVNIAMDHVYRYFSGVLDALYQFESVIDTDMCTIDSNMFNFKIKANDYIEIIASIKSPKEYGKVTVDELEFNIKIEDKFSEVASILAEIADYSYSCKDSAFSDNTKDFENINEFAIDALKILGEYKE